MRVESASSIQKVDSDDSIVAFQPDAADFFDSIGQNEPCHSLRRHGRTTSESGLAGPEVGASESGQMLTHALQQHGFLFIKPRSSVTLADTPNSLTVKFAG
jgi:hypothetical protein